MRTGVRARGPNYEDLAEEIGGALRGAAGELLQDLGDGRADGPQIALVEGWAVA